VCITRRFKNGDAVNVFDVWTTQAAFDAFGKTLMPILQGLGVDPGQPRVMDVHNVIVAPARKTTARKPATRHGGEEAAQPPAQQAVIQCPGPRLIQPMGASVRLMLICWLVCSAGFSTTVQPAASAGAASTPPSGSDSSTG
jgi:hypothetical protein